MKDTHGMTGEPWWGFDLDGTLAEYDGTMCGLSNVLFPMTNDLLGYILPPVMMQS